MGQLAQYPGDIVSPQVSSTATLTSVASSSSTVPLLAANPNRKGMTLFNESTQTLYLALAATASATAYTVQVLTNTSYQLLFDGFIYTGAISGIWASANGNARITELT